MIFTAGSALLDAVVLSVVSQGGTYGYKITQDVRKIMDVSESTLYPFTSPAERWLSGNL